jgi:hypothetical protein
VELADDIYAEVLYHESGAMITPYHQKRGIVCSIPNLKSWSEPKRGTWRKQSALAFLSHHGIELQTLLRIHCGVF